MIKNWLKRGMRIRKSHSESDRRKMLKSAESLKRGSRNRLYIFSIIFHNKI